MVAVEFFLAVRSRHIDLDRTPRDLLRHETVVTVGVEHPFHAQTIHMDDPVDRLARLSPLSLVVIAFDDHAVDGRRDLPPFDFVFDGLQLCAGFAARVS